MNKEKVLKEIVEWALTIIIPVLAALLIHTYLFTFARVDGGSMLDTFHSNNITGVSRLEFRIHDPQRGQIITCHYPGEGQTLFIKRIIGLPCETVELKERKLYINGEELVETYITRVDERNFGPYQVGEDEYFVLGDNRPISKDSRMVGCISRDDLYGLVMFVAYPFDEIRSTMELPLYHSIGEKEKRGRSSREKKDLENH